MFKNKPVDITRLSVNALKNLKEQEDYANSNNNSSALDVGKDQVIDFAEKKNKETSEII